MNIIKCDLQASKLGYVYLTLKLERRNRDIKQWNTEPKHFERKCHLLPEKKLLSILKVVLP